MKQSHLQQTEVVVNAQDAVAEVYSLNGSKLAEASVEGQAVMEVDDAMVIVRVVSGSDVTVKRVLVK